MTAFHQPGALLAATVARAREALTCGALQPLPTEATVVEGDGIRFVVRLLAAPARQHRALQPTPANVNPFLPYDPDLFVGDLSATHVALLNKFPVVDQHLLLVTRTFVPQAGTVSPADLAAIAVCLTEYDGLAFYNAGRAAGASQQHRHLQYVPLPLVPGTAGTPMDPILDAADLDHTVARCAGLPFAHALARLPDGYAEPQLLAAHTRLIEALALDSMAPHNLLVTRRWMLLVPRRYEAAGGIPVNAMGFVGALLVRSEEQLAHLRAAGPMAILRQVAVPTHRDMAR